MTDIPGVVVADSAVILHGPALRPALQALLEAIGLREAKNKPRSTAYATIAQALADAYAASVSHLAVQEPIAAECFKEEPDVSITEAKKMLNLSRRQTTRLAPLLGGRKIGGIWLLDRQAIEEHLQGKAN